MAGLVKQGEIVFFHICTVCMTNQILCGIVDTLLTARPTGSDLPCVRPFVRSFVCPLACSDSAHIKSAVTCIKIHIILEHYVENLPICRQARYYVGAFVMSTSHLACLVSFSSLSYSDVLSPFVVWCRVSKATANKIWWLCLSCCVHCRSWQTEMRHHCWWWWLWWCFWWFNLPFHVVAGAASSCAFLLLRSATSFIQQWRCSGHNGHGSARDTRYLLLLWWSSSILFYLYVTALNWSQRLDGCKLNALTSESSKLWFGCAWTYRPEWSPSTLLFDYQ